MNGAGITAGLVIIIKFYFTQPVTRLIVLHKNTENYIEAMQKT